MGSVLACLPPSGAVVAPGPALRTRSPGVGVRFSVRDRIVLDRWSHRAAAIGVRRVRLEQPEPDEDPEIACEFVQLYLRDPDWARWSLAPTTAGYLLWEASSGVTLACCDTLQQALALVEAHL